MREIYEDDIREGLTSHRGNVSMVAHLLGVTRHELFEYVRARPMLYCLVLGFREQLVDYAEMYLREALDKKLSWAIRFTLETLGKHRQNGQNTAKIQQLEQLQGNLGKLTIEEMVQADELLNQPIAAAFDANLSEPEFCQVLDQASDRVLEALTKYVGRQGLAAKELGVKKKQLAEYLARRPQLQAALAECFEGLSDHAEYVLHDMIDAQDPWAIKFVLKHLGRSRGYCDIPLNNMMTLSGGLKITRLSMSDLEKLDRIRQLAAPTPRPDKIGERPVLVGGPAPTSQPAPVSSNTGQSVKALPAKVETPALVNQAAPENAAPQAVPPVEAPVAVAATIEPTEAAAADGWTVVEVDCENETAENQETAVPTQEEYEASRFTPQQRQALEKVAADVVASMKWREIYNPAWPDDHPIYQEFDRLWAEEEQKKEEERKKKERPPPDST